MNKVEDVLETSCFKGHPLLFSEIMLMAVGLLMTSVICFTHEDEMKEVVQLNI